LKKIFFLATSNQQFCCKFHSKTHFFIFINLEKNQSNISHFISDKETHLLVANSSLACSIIIINSGFSLKEKDSKSNYFRETIAGIVNPPETRFLKETWFIDIPNKPDLLKH
jgi:hypothetical protein